MHTRWKWLGGLASALLVGSVLASAGAGRAMAGGVGQLLNVFVTGGTVGLDPAQANPVTIANTPSVTLSGTPSVTLSGTPTVALAGTSSVTLSGPSAVQASQSGSWNVGINGTPSVSVASDSTVFTHVRSKPSDLVLLTAYANPNGSESKLFTRILANGAQDFGAGSAQKGYQPPPGKLLVITDYNWRAFAIDSSATGDTYAQLELTGSSFLNLAPITSFAHMVTTGSGSQAFGAAAASVHLTSGIAMKAPLSLVGIVTNDGPTDDDQTVQGYLIDDL